MPKEVEVKYFENRFIKERYPFVMLHDRVAMSKKAMFTLSMLERWGMVTAEPDGEDSSGRQKLKIMKVDKMVERACDTVERAFREFEKRGWTEEQLSLEEIEKKFEEKEFA